jgi:hypothetical protein
MSQTREGRPIARFASGLYCDGHGRWRCSAHLPANARAWSGELADRRGWDHHGERFLRGFVERPACERCKRRTRS